MRSPASSFSRKYDATRAALQSFGIGSTLKYDGSLGGSNGPLVSMLAAAVPPWIGGV